MLQRLLRRNLLCVIAKRHESTSTIDKTELDHFEKFSMKFWDPKGPMLPLHAMNAVRVPQIKNIIENHIKNNNNFPKFLREVNVLDVGCGAGLLAEALAKLGFRGVTGLDPVKDLIRVAEDHNKTENNLRYVASTIEQFSKEHPNTFDVVVTSETVEHVSDIPLFVSECIKTLKPGGLIIITTINKTILAKLYVVGLLEIFKVIPRGTHHYEKLVSPDYLKEILHKNNCKVMEVQGTFFNGITKKWSLTDHCSFFYTLHAKKEL